jgi:hypothetical protein
LLSGIKLINDLSRIIEKALLLTFGKEDFIIWRNLHTPKIVTSSLIIIRVEPLY